MSKKYFVWCRLYFILSMNKLFYDSITRTQLCTEVPGHCAVMLSDFDSIHDYVLI